MTNFGLSKWPSGAFGALASAQGLVKFHRNGASGFVIAFGLKASPKDFLLIFMLEGGIFIRSQRALLHLLEVFVHLLATTSADNMATLNTHLRVLHWPADDLRRQPPERVKLCK